MSYCVSASEFKHKESIRCLFCSGKFCKRCSADAYKHCSSPALEKVHSSWITDNILAMQRPTDELISNYYMLSSIKIIIIIIFIIIIIIN